MNLHRHRIGETEFFTDTDAEVFFILYTVVISIQAYLIPSTYFSLFLAVSLLLYLKQAQTHHDGWYFKKMALISLDRPVCPLPQISAALPFHGAWPRRVIIPLSQVQGELMSEETDVPVSCLPLLPTRPPTPLCTELVTAHAAASPIWQHPLTNTRIHSRVVPPNYQFSTQANREPGSICHQPLIPWPAFTFSPWSISWLDAAETVRIDL